MSIRFCQTCTKRVLEENGTVEIKRYIKMGKRCTMTRFICKACQAHRAKAMVGKA